MSYFEILLLAAALSLDAFAVAVASGIRLCAVSGRQTFRMAGAFGFFQFFMPLFGWVLGRQVRGWIEAWDHWLAFGLLCFIGLKMIREAWAGADDNAACVDPTMGRHLFILAVATSIDALAVGITFAFLDVSILPAVLFIGLTTFVLSGLGVWIGHGFGAKFQSQAEFFGGLILIGMGIKILVEHLIA